MLACSQQLTRACQAPNQFKEPLITQTTRSTCWLLPPPLCHLQFRSCCHPSPRSWSETFSQHHLNVKKKTHLDSNVWLEEECLSTGNGTIHGFPAHGRALRGFAQASGGGLGNRMVADAVCFAVLHLCAFYCFSLNPAKCPPGN